MISMKQIFLLLFSFSLIGCIQNHSSKNQTLEDPVVIKQTRYEFKYDKLTASFQGQTQIKQIPGKIIFFKDEIHVFQGNQGEKFYIKGIHKNGFQTILTTLNNKNEKAIFKLYEKQNVSFIEVDLEDVLMNFSIVSGSINNMDLYDQIDAGSTNKFRPENQPEIDYCDCQVIHRDDGTDVTQCISLPVAIDNSLEFGLACASNGQEKFITVTLRFFDNVQGIAGNLSIRLKDNNMLTFNLVNRGFSYIGNNQVAQGVFALNEQKIAKLKSSELLTVSLNLDDNMVHTLECNLNTSVLREQLLCLTRQDD